jgi:hypothetical protein
MYGFKLFRCYWPSALWILIAVSTTGKYNPEDFLEYVQVSVVARLLGNNIM